LWSKIFINGPVTTTSVKRDLMPLKDTEEPANGVKRDLLVVSKKTY
jgi:hypothetical protein